jgi:DNA-binding XRE family transcriptional regulator
MNILIKANKIAEYRNKIGISQKILADKVGCTERAIRYYESGEQKPNVYVAMLIAAELNVPVYRLFPYMGEGELL